MRSRDPGPVPIIMSVITVWIVMASVVIWVIPSAINISRAGHWKKAGNAEHECKHKWK